MIIMPNFYIYSQNTDEGNDYNENKPKKFKLSRGLFKFVIIYWGYIAFVIGYSFVNLTFLFHNMISLPLLDAQRTKFYFLYSYSI